MRSRSGKLLLAVTFVCAALVVLGPATSAHHQAGPCGLHRLQGETVQQLSKRHIRCAVEEFGPVPGGAARAICIAKRESGLLPTARSATGMYLGLFQHSAAAWPDRYVTWTEPVWELSRSALRGRTNSIVTIRMVTQAGRWKAAGWPVKDC